MPVAASRMCGRRTTRPRRCGSQVAELREHVGAEELEVDESSTIVIERAYDANRNATLVRRGGATSGPRAKFAGILLISYHT